MAARSAAPRGRAAPQRRAAAASPALTVTSRAFCDAQHASLDELWGVNSDLCAYGGGAFPCDRSRLARARARAPSAATWTACPPTCRRAAAGADRCRRRRRRRRLLSGRLRGNSGACDGAGGAARRLASAFSGHRSRGTAARARHLPRTRRPRGTRACRRHGRMPDSQARRRSSASAPVLPGRAVRRPALRRAAAPTWRP